MNCLGCLNTMWAALPLSASGAEQTGAGVHPICPEADTAMTSACLDRL